MSFAPHQYGDHVILDQIGIGGMSKIFQARRLKSPPEKESVFALKRMSGEMSTDPHLVHSFEQELKVALLLQHRNIPEVLEYGLTQNRHFLVMDWLRGRNLLQLIQKMKSLNQRFEIGVACYLICEVLEALAYVHVLRDPETNEYLNVIHRDISPANIFVLSNGSVNLLDFGIAKIEGQGIKTKTGIIRGKPSYVSPEQVLMKGADNRSDIYSTAVVLWEVLTGERLFQGDDDITTLRQVVSGFVPPPSHINPKVDDALNGILLKALSREPHQRYQLASDFRDDLLRYLEGFDQRNFPQEVSVLLSGFFKSELDEEDRRLEYQLALPVLPHGHPNEEIVENEFTLAVETQGQNSESTRTVTIVKSTQKPPIPSLKIEFGQDKESSGKDYKNRLRKNNIELDTSFSEAEKERSKKNLILIGVVFCISATLYIFANDIKKLFLTKPMVNKLVKELTAPKLKGEELPDMN